MFFFKKKPPSQTIPLKRQEKKRKREKKRKKKRKGERKREKGKGRKEKNERREIEREKSRKKEKKREGIKKKLINNFPILLFLKKNKIYLPNYNFIDEISIIIIFFIEEKKTLLGWAMGLKKSTLIRSKMWDPLKQPSFLYRKLNSKLARTT